MRGCRKEKRDASVRSEMLSHGLKKILFSFIVRVRNISVHKDNPGVKMPALKKQRIDLRLTDEDKDLIEEAAAMTNQTITQFMVNSASERAAEVIEQHRRLILNEDSWKRVMDALDNPPEPNERLKRAARRLQNME